MMDFSSHTCACAMCIRVRARRGLFDMRNVYFIGFNCEKAVARRRGQHSDDAARELIFSIKLEFNNSIHQEIINRDGVHACVAIIERERKRWHCSV